MTLKISYVPGPGDVVGTYKYWRDGIEDPRLPVLTYSSMMYTAVHNLGNFLQVITSCNPPDEQDTWITFSQIDEPTVKKSYFINQLKRVRSIRIELNKYRPDVVVVASDVPAIFLFLLKSRKWKLCLSIHNTYWSASGMPYDSIRSFLKYFMTKENIKLTDAALCTSPECARQYNIMNNKNLPTFSQIPYVNYEFNPNNSTSVNRIIFLGRIEKNKGVFLLAKVINELSVKFPDITCQFAGYGNGVEKLIAYLEELNNKNIKYIGSLNGDEVHDFLHNADLLVVPTMKSFNEGLAKVGFESAVHLVPCLYSDVVPAKDFFSDSCSVFNADDEEDLKQKLMKLIEDDDYYKELRENLIKYVRKMNDPENHWGNQLVKMIHLVTKKN